MREVIHFHKSLDCLGCCNGDTPQIFSKFRERNPEFFF
jgi:hypothetical protein